jgi:hypothetical protein
VVEHLRGARAVLLIDVGAVLVTILHEGLAVGFERRGERLEVRRLELASLLRPLTPCRLASRDAPSPLGPRCGLPPTA